MINMEYEENTQTLKRRARNLINSEFRNDFPKENVTPGKRQAVNNPKNPYFSKSESVKDTRKKIRDEWNALKNSTIINNNSPIDIEGDSGVPEETKILYGVVAYIEVPNENRMSILKSKLEDLGATVKDSFSREVTHVIYKNGSLETYKRAKLLNVHLVSVLWIQACENSRAKISEKLFPTFEKNDYTNSPRIFRKFWTHQSKNFQYDESTGTISRKPQDTSQSILHHMKNLEINPERSNSNEIIQNVSNESTSKSTPTANSSTESIRLQLSSGEKNRSSENNSTLCIENNVTDRNPSVNNGTKTITKRKLFAKNQQTSLLQYSNDGILNSQNDKVILSNPYSSQNKNSNHMSKSTQPLSLLRPRSRLKNSLSKNKLPTLVTTYFHGEENRELKEIVKKLGGFNFKLKVDKTTTHVVVGECQRTPNILKGMARGCWILNKNWVYESAKVGHWLSEEYFELTEFSKIVQRCRIQKQAFGKYFSLDIFDECGSIYVSRECNSHYEDLKELIILCGGKLSKKSESAEIIIGHVDATSKECISMEWILDSITFGRCKTLCSKYVLTPS